MNEQDARQALSPQAEPSLLIVDDAQMMRLKIQVIAQAAGWKRITQAPNGEKAIELYQANRFDLITMDLVMPGIDGLDLARDIHRHPELSNREFRTAGVVADHLRASGMDVRTGIAHTGVIGILLSLYALNATTDLPVLEPLRAFKEFPNSAPYVGAFASHTEQILVPAVHRIKADTGLIVERLSGQAAPASWSGDFAFVVRPLPKIFLGYIFYEADEDFPASVTCLFSNNANRFMPMDGLADVGEYTSKTILGLVH